MYSISQEYYNFDMHAEDACCFLCVRGIGLSCFGSDLECCCLLSVHQRHADPVDNFTVHFVTIKCLGIVVLSLAAYTGSALGSRASSGWEVMQL